MSISEAAAYAKSSAYSRSRRYIIRTNVWHLFCNNNIQVFQHFTILLMCAAKFLYFRWFCLFTSENGCVFYLANYNSLL